MCPTATFPPAKAAENDVAGCFALLFRWPIWQNYLGYIFIIFVIVIVLPQFKRNIYLSLLCDWIFLCLKIIFLFFSSKYAVEACDINILFTADLVHFLATVQASHVICLHFCVADSVTPIPPCVFYFQSDTVCTFFPRAKYFNRQNSLLGSGGGGEWECIAPSQWEGEWNLSK